MTPDEIIASWVPWSTGETARYRTREEAAADLKYQLFEAGFVIVPREATEEMHDAARDWSYQKYGKPIGNDASQGCWEVMVQEAIKPCRLIPMKTKEQK